MDLERTKSSSNIEDDEVRVLAFTLWEQRGCPLGSPEQDWIEAEEMILSAKPKAKAASASA